MITDGPPQYFWKVLDQAVIAMGFTSLFSKFKIPGWLIMGLAYCVVFFGNIFSFLSGKKLCRRCLEGSDKGIWNLAYNERYQIIVWQYTVYYNIVKYYTTLYYTILYYTILYYTILYYTILYYTILYYIILYYTILYYTNSTYERCKLL